MELQKIHSFTINHSVHGPDFYLSGEKNGIFTYDLRFKWPNKGDYLDVAAMHTIEHLFATVIRNSPIKEQVVYFGPMGCCTGFYLLLQGITKDQAKEATIKAFEDCLKIDEVPGAGENECGNYKLHNLPLAKKEIEAYLEVLKSK